MPALLIHVIIALVILGVVLYLLQLIPMDETIKRIVHIIVVVAVVLWLLNLFLGIVPIVHAHELILQR